MDNKNNKKVINIKDLVIDPERTEIRRMLNKDEDKKLSTEERIFSRKSRSYFSERD